MFRRTARTAGKMPPHTPINTAINTPRARTHGPKRNAKLISLKVDQFAVPVEMPLNGNVARHPRMPPTKHSMTDSSRNDDRIALR